jgi:prepilin-type N-terminal cleavage/methylation domain-containing protein
MGRGRTRFRTPTPVSRCRVVASSHGGFTLLELIVIIAVLGILATVALPNLRTMMQHNRVVSQANELVALITYARSEAIRRDELVQVRLAADGAGWTAEVGFVEDFLDTQGEEDGETTRAPFCPEGVIRCLNNTRMQLRGADGDFWDGTLTFNSRGYLADPANATIWIGEGRTLILRYPGCDGASGVRQRRLHVLATGQIEGSSEACP